jgi:hypothetical protein
MVLSSMKQFRSFEALFENNLIDALFNSMNENTRNGSTHSS